MCSRLSPLAPLSSSTSGIFWTFGKTCPWLVFAPWRALRRLISPQEHFWRHFAARAVGLIVIPLIVYLSFFWVHFAILTHSGTGDSFMSPQFQESLAGSEMLMNSIGRRYFVARLPAMYLYLSQNSSITTPLLSNTKIPRFSCTPIPKVTHCVMMMVGSVVKVCRARCDFQLKIVSDGFCRPAGHRVRPCRREQLVASHSDKGTP